LDKDATKFIKITDCDGVGDGEATITADEKVRFFVMIRVVGQAGSSLELTCLNVTEVGGNDLCLIGTERFNKSNSFTKIFENVFDDENEEVLWTLDCKNNSGGEICAKHIQVRLYEKL